MTFAKEVGRPLKFEDPKALQEKIEAYFGDCDPHEAEHRVLVQKANGEKYFTTEQVITDQKPYTITGLAMALDTNRHTLLNYTDPEHYPDTIDDQVKQQLINTVGAAKLKCQFFAEQHLYTGKTPSGAVFALKNNYGWVDKTIVDNTNKNVETTLDELDKAVNGFDKVSQEAQKELEAEDAEQGSPPSK